MYRSRRNSVRTAPSSSPRLLFSARRPLSPSSSSSSSDRPTARSRASASERPSSVATDGGAPVPSARRASRARASHDSGAAEVSASHAPAGPSRPAAASHRPDGARATFSAPRASPATPRARTHARHAASASARRARAVPRLRRIAAVARAGLPIGRHARARLSPERRDPIERRVGSEAVDTTRLDRARDERQRRPAAFAPWGVVEKKKRNLVCVSVRIDPNASAAKRAVLLRLRFGATRLGSRLKNPSRIVSVGQTDRPRLAAIGTRPHSHARRKARAEAQLSSPHRV